MKYDNLQYDEAREGVPCPDCGALLESIESIGEWSRATYDNPPCWNEAGWLYRCPDCGHEFIAKEEI